MPFCQRLSVVLVLALALTARICAQVQTGIPPFGSFGGGPDVINLANLNSHIAFPILQKSGRGLPFNYTLTYESTFWIPQSLTGTQTWTPDSSWGWGVQAAAAVGYLLPPTVTQTTKTCIDDQGKRHLVTYTVTTYHRFRDPLGTTHPVLLALISGSGICNIDNGSAAALTKDGSGWYLSVPDGTATTRMGQVYQLAVGSMAASGSATDTNGNQITSTNGTSFYDTLNSKTAVLTVAGSGTPSNPMTYSYTPPSGGTVSYTMKYTTFTIQTNFGCSGITEYGSNGTTTANLVSEIDLPDGSKYTFGYEGTPGYSGHITGRLASVTFPTGGTITYKYTGANNGIVCADGTAAGLQRNTPDTGSAYWNYQRTAGSGAAYTTTVTDPQGNVTTVQFQGIYETQRVVNQGSSTILTTTNTCYNGATSPCTGTAITLPITARSASTQLAGTKNLTDLHTYTYDNYGDLLGEMDYDYAAGSHGSLLANTSIGYASLGSIVGLPASVVVLDGNQNTVSQTIYNYDQTPVQPTSGTPQQVSVSGSRGNLTSANLYTAKSTYLTRTMTYFDTGNVQTATDVNGAQTTYSYGACGNSFPTSVSEPLGMSRSFAWNCTGGAQTSATDENNQTVTSHYDTDPYFWRPNAIVDQSGNQANYYYQPNPPNYITPAEVALGLVFNNGNSLTEDIQYKDGLGRTYVDQHRPTPNSSMLDSVSYTYDANGRPNSVSIPCSIGYAQTCSTPKTTQTYDALNRPLLTTDGGGGTVSYSYSNNDVYVTIGPNPSGENTKRRQLEYDALGRLTSVCEITSLAGSGTCGQNSAQTGYWTKYSYNPLGQITGVTQNAQSSSTQTRSYVYDLLGRLTSETNPESGTTTYVWDTSYPPLGCGTPSAGDISAIAHADGRGLCFAHDSLHRMTGEGTSDLLCRFFVYDSATVNGQVMSNAKGRLAEAWTAQGSSCSPRLTDEGFSYTQRGEVSDVWESTPHSGGYYHSSASYWANGVLNSLNAYSASNAQFYGAGWNVDGEGRVYSNYNTGSNPLSVTTYNSASQSTKLSFSSGDSDSYTYDPNTGRMTQYQFNMNNQAVMTGSLTWNPNATLQQLAISDGFNGSNSQTCNYQHDDLVRIANVNCPGNQLQNPGFESGSTNWSLGGGFSVVNNSANSQSGSWYLSGSGTGVTTATATPNGSNWIPVTPGQVVYFGGWIKRVGGTGTIVWGCEVVDANHNLAAWCGDGAGLGDGSGGTSWQLYQTQITIPSNGAYIQFYAQIHCCGDTDTSLTSAYFDSAFLEAAPVWSQAFNYDAFGNITKNGTSSFQPTYSSTTNRMTTIGGSAPSYDADGNVTNDFLHSYAWNAYGQATTIDGVGITYDALGRMVEQNRSGTYTQFLYSPTGFKMINLNGQSAVDDFVPLPGGAVAVYSPGGIYLRHADWLGSSRFTSWLSSRTVYYDGAYGPFGEPYAQLGTTDLSFTGMNQDTVANLYDFPAREYGTQGRWASPDPAGLAAVDPTNPQSWNRYAYVLNNPLAFIDPLGLHCQWADGTSDQEGESPEGSSPSACESAGGTWVVDYSPNITNFPGNPQGLQTCSGVAGQATNCSMGDFGPQTDPMYNGSNGPSDPSGTPPAGPTTFSWVWNFTKSFVTFAGGPGNVPTCAGQTLQAMANELLGAQASGAPASAEVALSAASVQQAGRAAAYAAGRPNSLGGVGLICPNCSSVFRSMMSKAEFLADASEALPLIEVGVAALNSGWETAKEARNGGCSAAFPIF